MILKNKILALATLVLAAGCVEENLEAPAEKPGNGETCISFRSSAPELVMTRASEGDSRIENAIVFVFNGEDCVAKQWSYVGDDNKMYMYLPSGTIDIYAVCNMLDPETLMNSVQTLEDLRNADVTISEWSGAYKGKYVMSGNVQLPSGVVSGTVEIPVERVAAQFDINLLFRPENVSDQFMVSEVTLYNVPKGTWILPKNDTERPALEERGGTGDIEESGNFVLAKRGSSDDWTWEDVDGDMSLNYFPKAVISYEGEDIGSADGLDLSFSMFENRRGILDDTVSDPVTDTDPFAVNWPDLYRRNEAQRKQYAQLWKYALWNNVCQKSHVDNLGMKYATYLTISGLYSSGNDKWQVTYYVFLGKDNYRSYDVERNHKYDMTVTVKALDQVDTRVDDVEISDMVLYYNEETVLDAHCNTVRSLLYSPGGWEVWVKDPDKTPWLELSTMSDYKPNFLGTASDNTNAGFRIGGDLSGMRYIYIHTDEYVPDLGSPEANNSVGVREGTVCYRKTGDSSVHEFTVRQYPAQMVILYIEHDVNNLMKEVRDTFYVERILEQKHKTWGFGRWYWSLEMDTMIAKGQWDGFSNTRTLYDCAMDFYGENSPYDGENCIPTDVALRNILDKNRDRNGNGYVDRDEIMWFMPAINEMEALYEAREQLLVEFEGDDDYFFSSTPSSSDPSGITQGYAYYIKMGSGKTGLAQRNMEYNFIACRRTNAWRGPETASGSGTVNKDETWNEEEVIMPKN